MIEHGSVLNLNDYKGPIKIEDNYFNRNIIAYESCESIFNGYPPDMHSNLGAKPAA